MWVQFLSQEDPLEKGMATHTSILACRIPRAEEPGRLQSMGLRRVGHDLATGQQQITCPPRQWWWVGQSRKSPPPACTTPELTEHREDTDI